MNGDGHDEASPPLATYFVLDESAQRLKIGRTINLDRRLRDLARGCGVQLKLLRAVTGDVEQSWHRRFREERLEGEWFRLSPTVVKALRDDLNIALPPPRRTRPPEPAAIEQDWRLEVETLIGAPMHSLPEEVTDKEAFEDWMTLDVLDFTPDLSDPEDEPADPDEADIREQMLENYDQYVAEFVSSLSPWWDAIIGWNLQDAGEVLWRDLWLVAWKPKRPIALIELRRASVRAAWASDHDLLEALRLRVILVDSATGELEVLPPEELYDLEVQWAVVFNQNLLDKEFVIGSPAT